MDQDSKQTGMEELDPMERKTNEQIETDDEGRLIIGGVKEKPASLPSDGPISQDRARGGNELADQQGIED